MLRNYTFETNIKRYLIGEHLALYIDYYIRKVNIIKYDFIRIRQVLLKEKQLNEIDV